MKHLNRLKVLLLLVLLLFPLGCRKEEQEVGPTQLTPRNITVAEAKVWFEQILQKQPQARLNNTTYSNTEPQWKFAKEKRFSDGKTYVQVPLQFKEKMKRYGYVQREGKKANEPKERLIDRPLPQLIVFNDKDGHKQLQVMELLPEEGYQKKSSGFIEKESYSGAQLIKNWEGELLYGYFYKNGKRAGSIRLKSKDSNGRTAGWCTTYTTYHLSGTCIERGLIIVYGTSVMVRDQEPLIMPPPPVSADGDPYYCSNWSIDYSTQEQHCYDDGGGDDGGGGGGPAPEPVYPIAIEELKADNTSLYGPCPGLTDSWRYQINFKPPQSVINKLEQLAQDVAFMNSMDRPIENLPNSWFVQSIKNAEGIAINVDNFSVYFTEFPVINGQRVDMNGLMDYVRTNINDFVSPDHGSFSPHSATGTDEGAIWNSSNPVGAVLSIAIPVDQGSVICSQYSPGYQSASWTFSTIHDPYNNNHPVSGNRTFGIYESGNGWVFYTQGADRLTGYFDSLLGIVTKAMNGQELQFAKSDEMWKNFQAKIAQFLNENDGISGVNTAEVRTPVTNRPDWQKVKEALENNLSLSTVPCP